MRLDLYQQRSYTPGAPLWKQTLWFWVGLPILRSYLLPFSLIKISVLRLFGAKIGQGVRIKPGVVVKFPWRLKIGAHCWIGEGSWIDNLAVVEIGEHCCISQGTYFCTGNHDWKLESFDLRTQPIRIGSHAWIAAQARVGPGVKIGEGAVLGFAGVASKDLEPWTIYRGNPAERVAARPRVDVVPTPQAGHAGTAH